MNNILKVLVGSQAHGLATPESDNDYRGVFVVPTIEILSLGSTARTTSWIEGKDDDTSWEIGHFLNMATKCNPTILEVFLAPVISGTAEGEYLRALFPFVWNSADVMNAFIGYGLNQRKKFLDNKDVRPSKYAVAYLRTLYQAWELLSTGTFTIKVSETEVGETLRRWKQGGWTVGEVMQLCVEWEQKVKDAYKQNPDKKTDIQRVNSFLLETRYLHWK